jgi:hypothetical protein
MSETLIATNEDAENLWKYIIAYRKQRGNTSIESMQDLSMEDNITVGVIPLEELAIAKIKNPKD